MKPETHYICRGECHGVSAEPKRCENLECSHHGEPLERCECLDGGHHGAFEEHNEAEENE